MSAQGPLVLGLGLRVWGQGLTKVILYIVFFRSITLVTDRKPVLERKQLSFHLVLPGAKKRNLLGKGAPKFHLLNVNST